MEYLLTVIVLLGLIHTVRIFRVGRASKQENPALDYLSASTPNSDEWRWRRPLDSVGLTIIDEPQSSRIDFDPQFNSSDYLFGLGGFTAYGVSAVAIVMGVWFYFFGGEEDGARVFGFLLLGGLGLFFGAAALSVRQRLLALIRTPDHLEIVYSYGSFFKRTSPCSKKKTSVEVVIKEQSIGDYDNSQKMPFYEMQFKGTKFISAAPVKFYVSANQSQATWLRGGVSDYFHPTSIS